MAPENSRASQPSALVDRPNSAALLIRHESSSSEAMSVYCVLREIIRFVVVQNLLPYFSLFRAAGNKQICGLLVVSKSATALADKIKSSAPPTARQ